MSSYTSHEILVTVQFTEPSPEENTEKAETTEEMMSEEATFINEELEFESFEGIDEGLLFLMTFDWFAN